MASRKKIENTILEALDRLHPTMRKAFLKSISDIQSNAQIGMISAAIDRGDTEAAIAAMHIKPEMFQPLDDAMRAVYVQGGRDAMAGVPALTDPFPGRVWWHALRFAIHAQRLGLQSSRQR